MAAISRPWYNGSYTMAAKPIKSLELHYTMIQFLIMALIIHQIFSLARDWSKRLTSPNIPQLKLGNIRGYSPSDIPQFQKLQGASSLQLK